MPLIDDTPSGFSLGARAPAPEPDAPSFLDAFEANFRLESDVKAAVDILARPVFDRKPGYEVGPDLREYDRKHGTDFFNNYPDNFMGSQSPEETRFILGRIMDEQKDRDTAARGGFASMLGGIAGGTLSPLTFMPVVGPLTRARTAWQFAKEASLLGAAAGTIQEGILHAGQETRTLDESVTGVAAQTVLSGLLGGALGHVLGKEMKALEKSLNETTAMAVVTRPGSLNSASAVAESPGTLASGAITAAKLTDSNALTRNPVSFNVVQPQRATRSGLVPDMRLRSDVARDAMTQLGDGGFRFEGNVKGVPTTEGGTIENRIQTWYSEFPSVIDHLDNGFLNYRFEGAAPKVAPGIRAGLADALGQTAGKMTKSEYKAAITDALRNGDEHSIPQVAATAKHIREKLINPILREAQAAGVIGQDIDLKGDTSWIFRDYDRRAIKRNTAQFVDTLAAHFHKTLEEEFAKSVDSLKKSQARSRELIEDLQRPADEVAKLKEDFAKKLQEMEEEANTEHFTALEDTVAQLRANARALKGATSVSDQALRKQFLADAKEMEKTAGESYEKFKGTRADVRRRIKNLNRSISALGERQQAKLERVERVEELSLNALRRAARVGQRVLKQMNRWSDEKLDAEVSKLKNQFADTAETYDRGVERIVKLTEGEDGDVLAGVREEFNQEARAGRLTDIAERLEAAEGLDRDAIRQSIEDMETAALRKIQQINAKRAERAARMREQAAKLDPATAAARVEREQAKLVERELNFRESWRTRGADDVDIDGGKAVFREEARRAAIAAKDRIMGTHLRLPAIDAQAGATRGSAIDRVLNIPSEPIKDFLENDVERLMRTTLRTMVPDIELAKRFGDASMSRVFGDRSGINAGELAEEMQLRIDEVKTSAEEKLAKAKTPEEKAKIEKALKKDQEEITDTFALYRRNLEAVQGRLRHTWGLPVDPEAMGYRLGKTLLNLNTLRLMGGVIISSIPDVARPVMRYGLVRSMRDGFLPLITNFKNMKLTMEEVRWLAGGLDATMQSRASAIFDLLDDVGRGGKFEQTIEFASRRIGLIALFDKWTQGMKELSGAVAHAKFMDAIDSVAGGGSKLDKAEATRYLAENSIGSDMAQRIWEQMVKHGGADRVDGRWWPNTKAWPDDIRQTYSQAVIREVNNSIITPGVDKPLWIDQSMMGRLLGQFRSFAFASTSRTLIAGMQQRDAAFVNGMLMSLALGALGYYTYAKITGGKTETEMMNAGLDKWADEAISRSGLLGILGEVQRLAENIPSVQPYVTFSGTRSTRRGGDDLISALAGPSLGLFTSAADVLANINDPSQHDIHQLRTLLPFQNVFFLRQLFDLMEKQVPVDR